MQWATFEAEFGRLTRWYGKKLSPEQVTLWFNRVAVVPDEAFPLLVDSICDTQKFFPTPQDVRNTFQDWLASNPQKRADPARTWCPDCNGSGALRVQIEEKRGIRDTLYRCRACRNWEGCLGTWIPLAYRSELEHRPHVTVLTPLEREDGEAFVQGHMREPEGERGRGIEHVRGALPELSHIKPAEDLPF